MRITDKVYGKTEVTEPVILELLKAPSVLRSKRICQYGIPDKYYHLKNFSRYDHCVGVMLLLRKLGATIEEQVSGLLHDVSHLAFSHVADWVFSEGAKGKEGLHDRLHLDYIKNSEILKILTKHDIDPQRVADEKGFSLLENEIPDICADRVDYSLREFVMWADPEAAHVALSSMANLNGEIIFLNCRSAYIFATRFLKLQTEHWGSELTVCKYSQFSEILKRAIKTGVVARADFDRDDSWVMKKLTLANDDIISKGLKELSKDEVPDSTQRKKKVYKKFRHVDPKVLTGGKLERLSKLSKRFKKVLAKHKAINKKGVLV